MSTSETICGIINQNNNITLQIGSVLSEMSDSGPKKTQSLKLFYKKKSLDFLSIYLLASSFATDNLNCFTIHCCKLYLGFIN